LRSSAACLIALSLLLLGLVTTQAFAEGLDENQLKAAYLFNFARYVEWPKESHDSKGSSLEIGVVGGGAVSELLLKTVSGKKVGNRQLHGVDVRSHTDARSSHIFLSQGNRARTNRSRSSKTWKALMSSSSRTPRSSLSAAESQISLSPIAV
jgi:hypothetical protein